MKIDLNKRQVAIIIQALEWSQDLDNFTLSDPTNVRIQRIINKFKAFEAQR